MPPRSITSRPSYLERLSLTIQRSLENFFYNWGHNIAINPSRYIIACLVLSITCAFGMLSFTPENRPVKLWVPWNSEFVRDSEWLKTHFPSPIRFHYVIVTAEDVLQPKVMQALYDIHKEVKDISVNGITWSKICFTLPVTKLFKRKRRRRRQVVNTSESDPFDSFGEAFSDLDDELPMTSSFNFDPSISLSNDIYCGIIDNLDEACWESNFVELFDFNEAKIKNLTREDILAVANSPQISPVFGRAVNYTTEFGGVERNETGHIVKAGAVTLRFFGKINQTAIKNGESANDLGTGELVDKNNLLWEKQLAKVLSQKSKTLPPEISMYFGLARSFGDISQATIFGDATYLVIGFSIVFMYVVFMLGKFNFVEQRPFLSLAGLSCVGLAIVVSYGLCSAFRTIYGPVHNVLPFLLLGIGIDDMFVIMQCWNNMSATDASKRPLPERMGLTLKHAGVSITVTSVTDFVAFAIGATTVLPALQSFCIYAAVGVIATYIFQATFFVAWFALDQKRIEDKRNAFIWCIRHDQEEYTSNKCSQISFAQLFFDRFYSKYLFKTPVKFLVFTITGLLLGINIWGNVLLRQEFNPMWFLPQDSYLFQYHLARVKYFPGRGHDGFIIIQNVSFPENLQPLESLVNNLESSGAIFELDSWYPHFKKYANTHFQAGIPNASLSSEAFYQYFGKFLFSPSGSMHRGRIKFDGNLTCGGSSPPILVTSIPFKFKYFKGGSKEHLPAMRKVKSILRNANFTESRSAQSFVWSFIFASWETDEIITVELYRNMCLAMICVLITTLLLIANFTTCIMVLTCVAMTLVDVGGMMHFWNLTIDTVSCIDLVLAIGLCVDYAAHIGHAFMTVVGTRNERAKQALINIGPAVLNGGFSTFLAFVLLANSRSHVFITFFKIFFLVVAFGLFHGLVFLPVFLSVMGPQPYPSAFKKSNEEPQELMKLNTQNQEDVPRRENGQIMINDEPSQGS